MSEYVDGDVAGEERAAIERHLAACAACAGLAADFRRLRAAAQGLGPIAPPDHVWLQIAGGVHAEGGTAPAAPAPRRAIGSAARQWIGLAAALVLVTSAAYWISRRPAATPAPANATVSAPAGGNAAAPGSVEAVASELQQAAAHYESAIAQLQALTKNNDGAVPPAVQASLERNMSVIDQAISESRQALQKDPMNEPARDSLFDALRRKVTVLQETVALMNEMRKGNQAGAARIVAGRSS